MIVDVLRLTSAWLQDATYGLNAQLDAVPRDGADVQPADITTFADETTHEEAALGQLPASVPCCVVSVASATVVNDQVATDVGDGTITLEIRIAVADVDAKDAKRDGSYYLRALLWCLRSWIRQDPGSAARARNSVAVLEIGPIECNALFERVEDVIITAGARVPLVVRDYGLA